MNARLVIFIISLFIMSSCQNELLPEIDKETNVTVLPNGDLQIPLSLILPQRCEIASRSNTVTSELNVQNIWALVIQNNKEDNTGNNEIISQIKNIKVEESGKYYIVLEKEINPCKLQLLVNISGNAEVKLNAFKTSIENNTYPSYQEYKSCVHELDQLYNGIENVGKTDCTKDFLPMASKIQLMPNGITTESTKGLRSELYFNYSRIDIKASELITNFEIISATLVNGALNTPLSQSDTLPIKTTSDAICYQESHAIANKITPIYLFPNSGALKDMPQGSNKTFLVLRGIYTDEKNNRSEGYYKVAIRTLVDNTDEFIYDVSHNTLYTVTIKSVKNGGYQTFEGAVNASETNINYDIIIDDGSSHDIVVGNGEYYMGMSNSEAWFYIFTEDNAEPIEVILTSITLGTADGMKLPEGNLRSIFSLNPHIEIINQDDFINAIAGETINLKARINKSDIEGEVSLRCGNLTKNITVRSFQQVSFKKDFYLNVPNVVYAKITRNEDNYLRLNTSEEYPSAPTPIIETPTGNLYICALRNKVESERFAETFILRKNNLGTIKLALTQQKWAPKYVTYYYDRENNDISKRANAYMLPLVDEKTIFKISSKRVDDYWKGDWSEAFAKESGYIFNGNNLAMTLNENPNWKPIIVWADFNYSGKLDVNRSGNDGIDIMLNHDYTSNEINAGCGGNVVIAVVNTENGEILWSWHLWLTDLVIFNDLDEILLKPNSTFKLIGEDNEEKIILDRSLGANTNNGGSDITKSYGLYYQWGRKDPFPKPTNGNTNEPIIYTPYGSGDEYIKKEDKSSTSTVTLSIKNPLTFYMHGKESVSSNFDWIGSESDANYGRMNRWNYIDTDPSGQKDVGYGIKGSKTIFDPCPYGWRIPWGEKWLNNSPIQNYREALYLPMSGYRTYNNGDFSFIGEEGRFWSGSCTTISMACYSTNNYKSDQQGRAYGYSVLPVKD